MNLTPIYHFIAISRGFNHIPKDIIISLYIHPRQSSLSANKSGGGHSGPVGTRADQLS